MSNGNKSDSFWYDGLQFTCTSCGHCCRYEPGYVFLSDDDVETLSNHLKITDKVFLANYCRIVNLGITNRLSLTEKDNNDCIFWSDGCTVYRARPLQCRTYPFWPSIMGAPENWERESLECPGINRGKKHSAREIRREIRKRERQTLITP